MSEREAIRPSANMQFLIDAALPNSDDFMRLLQTWFDSPFLRSSAHIGSALSRLTRASTEDLACHAVNPRNLQVALWPLGDAPSDFDYTSDQRQPLVDRYMLGQFAVGFKWADYAKFDLALRTCADSFVHIHVSAFECVRTTPHGFVSWLLSGALMRPPGPFVQSSIWQLLSVPGGDNRATLGSAVMFLPTPAGIIHRVKMIEKSHVATPAATYFLTCTLLPEVSPQVLPTLDSVRRLLDPESKSDVLYLRPASRGLLMRMRLRQAALHPWQFVTSGVSRWGWFTSRRTWLLFQRVAPHSAAKVRASWRARNQAMPLQVSPSRLVNPWLARSEVSRLYSSPNEVSS